MDEIDYNTPEYDADDSDIEEEDRDKSLEASFIRLEIALEIFRKLAEKRVDDIDNNFSSIDWEDVISVFKQFSISESDLTITKENEG